MKWVSGKSYFAIAFRGSIWNMTSWGDTFLEEEVLFFIIPEDEEARTGSWLLYIMAAVWSCSSNPWIVPTMFRFSSIWGAMNTIKIFLEWFAQTLVLIWTKKFKSLWFKRFGWKPYLEHCEKALEKMYFATTSHETLHPCHTYLKVAMFKRRSW